VNVLTIARFTLHEAVSRRLILAGLILSVAFVALFAVGFSFLYDAGRRAVAVPGGRGMVGVQLAILTLLGLYAVNFLASFLALFLSVAAISGEVDSGTLQAVLARPLRRAELIVGRWLAYVGLIAAYVGLMAAAVLLIARLISDYEPADAGRAVALMMLGSVLLVSLSLFGSTLWSTLANGVVVFTLFGLAWLAGIIEFIGSVTDTEAMINLGIAVSLLVPSDAVWRGASYYVLSPTALVAVSAVGSALPFGSTTPPSVPFLIWATAYPVLFLGAAIYAFGRRDL
jgi:Cu-processing system permease protein